MDLSKYDIDIEHVIGRGEFGTVYKAWSKQRRSHVAIKQIPLEDSAKAELERRGADLQRQLARAHENLVPEIYDDGVSSGSYYIVMELIQGHQLDDLIARRSLRSDDVARIGAAIAEFLAKAHALSICHSDLKPKHVIVLADGSVRVIDFGITGQIAPGRTSRTSLFATRLYAAPEQLESGRVNPAADRWALGVMLFEMVSGYHPYHHVRDTETAIIRGDPMAPLPADCLPDLRRIIDKLLAHPIDRRYKDAGSIAVDLRGVLNGEPSTSRVGVISRDVATLPRPIFDDRPTTRVPPPATKRGFLRDTLRFTAGLMILALVLSEGTAWVLAERLRSRIDTLGAEDIGAARSTVGWLHRLSPSGLTVGRVAPLLKRRLLLIADRVIQNYRTETPHVTEVDWRAAARAVALAKTIGPGDPLVESRARTIAGHIERVRAKDERDLERAILEFRAAAALDPSSPDPFLGLARIHAFHKKDLEALVDAIREAETRGFVAGRRERAELGEAYRLRGDTHRVAATELDGMERLRKEQAAVNAYEKCIANLSDLHFGDSEKALAHCQSNVDNLKSQRAHLAR